MASLPEENSRKHLRPEQKRSNTRRGPPFKIRKEGWATTYRWEKISFITKIDITNFAQEYKLVIYEIKPYLRLD